ncbi:KEX1 protein [Rickenella mellea]|uniref:Carboxypeptidase n=1 Tax=Rickenella mellea TaxID=50990 RepID=A0A4R5XED3_9AGAM|nr:KEX1 protein [Rickenella mellea]
MFMTMLWPPYLLLLVSTLLGPTATVSAAPTDVPSAASFYVARVPDLHQNDERPLHVYAGHISSDPNARTAPPTDVTAHLFFVLVKARRSADKERVLFWFNGGPGCSSLDGLMMEVGPWRVDGKGGLNATDGGWEEYTTMVYVDQPAGTGLSYTSTNHFVHELSDAAGQVVEFLQNFYDVFPEYQDMETYVAGESYAGQYIPYIADAILSSRLRTPLKGVAIGNGWMDGRSQYPSYIDYAVKHGILEEGSATFKQSKDAVDQCLKLFEDNTGPEIIQNNKCDQIMGIVSKSRRKTVNGQLMCMNIYDVRLDDTSPACGMNWPPGLDSVTTYLGRADVKRAFHASRKAEAWRECTGRVQEELYNRRSASSITIIPKLLGKIPILLFAGDQDLICNYMGIESMIQKMTWNGATGLGTVETKSWSVDEIPAGTWVESRNLTYVKVFNSSHMVPFDVPNVAHDMILRFMGVNFSAITEGSAKIPSKVGDNVKPSFVEAPTKDSNALIPVPPGKTPEQDKAMWEAYYNAGSAALVLLLIAIAIGMVFYCRRRRRHTNIFSLGSREEHIPLSQSVPDEGVNGHGPELDYPGKGKGRAIEEHMVFDVGNSDDEGDYRDDSRRS